MEEECYKSMLAFPFVLYFHIRDSSKNMSLINAKIGVVKVVVQIFLTTKLPLLVLHTLPSCIK